MAAIAPKPFVFNKWERQSHCSRDTYCQSQTDLCCDKTSPFKALEPPEIYWLAKSQLHRRSGSHPFAAAAALRIPGLIPKLNVALQVFHHFFELCVERFAVTP